MGITNKDLYDIQEGKCFYCLGRMNRVAFRPNSKKAKIKNGYTQDHFFPRSNGNNLNGNKVLAHHKCNKMKANKMPGKNKRRLFFKMIELKSLELALTSMMQMEEPKITGTLEIRGKNTDNYIVGEEYLVYDSYGKMRIKIRSYEKFPFWDIVVYRFEGAYI